MRAPNPEKDTWAKKGRTGGHHHSRFRRDFITLYEQDQEGRWVRRKR